MTAVDAVALTLGCGAVMGDLRRRTIPNWLNIAALAAGLALAAWSRGWSGLLPALGGAVLGILLFAIPYLAGGLGGGDLKLMAAFGSLLGPAGIFVTAILAALAGALLAAAVSVLRPRVPAIPYAPAIVAGAWLVMLGRR